MGTRICQNGGRAQPENLLPSQSSYRREAGPPTAKFQPARHCGIWYCSFSMLRHSIKKEAIKAMRVMQRILLLIILSFSVCLGGHSAQICWMDKSSGRGGGVGARAISAIAVVPRAQGQSESSKIALLRSSDRGSGCEVLPMRPK